MRQGCAEIFLGAVLGRLKEADGAVDAVGLWDLDEPEVLRWALVRGEASCQWSCMWPTMRDVDVHGESVRTYFGFSAT